MSVDFLKEIGFQTDPFASTNAADEPLIDKYFVEPPFFPAVIGDPSHPKSNVVFAPRGGGKTAQKIMIERRSDTAEDFLCVSYDRFPTETLRASAAVPLDYHLLNITRTLYVALITLIEERKIAVERFADHERQLLVTLSRDLLGNISAIKFKEAVDSIKSFGDKAQDVWLKYCSSITAALNTIAEKYGFGKANKEDLLFSGLKDEGYRFKFESIVEIILKCNVKSIYISRSS